MITDCITFFNGLDILEIRLNSLAPYVDRFVIVESPYNMVCKKKPLHFSDNKERFKDFNITHLVVEDHEKHMGGWTPYWYQIDYMMRALSDLEPNDMVMLSDFDEIPNMENYDKVEGVFRQKLYYYYLDVFTGNNRWKGTRVLKKKNIISLSKMREARNRDMVIGDGWHFSYVCSVEDIIDKIESFCHQELNTEDIKEKVAKNKANLVDPFNRNNKKYIIEMPSGPKWLLENREKYKNLFYGNQEWRKYWNSFLT